jgi:hypothetical protein
MSLLTIILLTNNTERFTLNGTTGAATFSSNLTNSGFHRILERYFQRLL